jgi:hypothetical protein
MSDFTFIKKSIGFAANVRPIIKETQATARTGIAP